MPALKRKSEQPSAGKSAPSAGSSKKQRPEPAPAASLVDASQMDFPRGGGSGLSAFEHASTLKEARAEMSRAKRGDDDLFKEAGSGPSTVASTSKKALTAEEKENRRRANRERNNAKKKKISFGKGKEEDEARAKRKAEGKDHIRIEHLNYKRLATGTRLLCSIAAVHPLVLILSLPNQLVGHVPITSISPIFTQKLHEAADSDNEEESDVEESESDAEDTVMKSGSKSSAPKLASGLPELRDCYKVGQWVRAAVVVVHPPGVTRGAVSGQDMHEFDKESRRVELTLAPEALNDGISAGDLAEGFVLPVAIKSREDNGFLLDTGMDDVSGFVPFSEVGSEKLYPGQVMDAAITSVASEGRSFTASLKPAAVQAAALGPQDAPSSTALLPGNQVSALVTASLPTGLNAKLWGMFDATMDTFHLPVALPEGKEMHEVYKVGSKIKARILWEAQKNEMGSLSGGSEASTGPRAVALSAAPHVVSLSAPTSGKKSKTLQDAYPIGTKVEAKVRRTDAEWGLTCSIGDNSQVSGFTHISRVSDDHIVKLPSRAGPFALGTSHEARVIGHAPTDRLLLLSFQKSTLAKSFMRVNEVEVGSTVKGNIARFGTNGNAIFVNLGGAYEGVVFPLHFADVPLKKPEKKYKPGASVKARVLSVDSTRNRIVLTLKKSLVGSDLPTVASIQDARVGVVTQGTVSKFIEDRGLLVDLFGGLRAFVPTSEATETPLGPAAPTLQSYFYEGKVVKVRLTNVDYENSKLMASVKQASDSFLARLDVAAVSVGEKITATVAAVHQDVVVLELQPSKVRGLLSLNILASQRGIDVEQLRDDLQDGEELSDLIVVDKHAERGLVIVGDAKKSAQTSAAGLSEPLAPGSLQTGRVAPNSGEPNTATIFLNGGCRGRLHLTDAADDYDLASLPKNGETIQVCLLRLRNAGKRADVIARPSRLNKGSTSVVKDAEFDKASDLKVGAKVRGFVKSISPAGLFVDIGRSLTARVLISELFDDYIKEWQGKFEIGQLVAGTITAVDVGQSKVELSLRSEPGSSKKSKADRAKEKADRLEAEKTQKEAGVLKFKDLKKGMKVNAFVRAVQDYGIFVQVEDTQISGLAHKSQLTDNTSTSTDPTKAFKVGDRVKAIVLDVKTGDKKKVDFGLKPSYFDDADFEEDGDNSEEDDDEAEDDDEMTMADGQDESNDDSDDDSDIEMDAEALLQGDSDDEDLLDLEDEDADEDQDSDDEEDSEDESSEDEDLNLSSTTPAVKPKSSKTSSAPSKVAPLELAGGFSWSIPEGADDPAEVDSSDVDSSSDDDDDADADGKKRIASKKSSSSKVKRGHNRAIEDDLTADLSNKTPESSADFERMLLSKPNSSYLWIQFMSFQLQLSEVDAAREVANRALQVINYREEREKLNVWIALLNLENQYGSEETLDKTFKDAVQRNDAKTVHLKMTSILEKTSKIDKAIEIWQRACKKFGSQHVDIWTGFATFYLRQGRPDEARSLLPRALQSLEKRNPIEVMTGFALSEFKMGDVERGRTIFEGLVDTYPKRLDLWWQYIDQEAAQDQLFSARSLFERVLNLKQSTKKGKSILKKWLDFEKRKGDAKGEKEVLDRARRFVEEFNERKAKQAKEAGGDDDAEMDDEDEDDEE